MPAGKGARSEIREGKSKHVDGLITYHPAFERDPYMRRDSNTGNAHVSLCEHE
jgi:hypothetical protein